MNDILTYLDSLAEFFALYILFDTICMWEAPISGSKRRLARGRTPQPPPQQHQRSTLKLLQTHTQLLFGMPKVDCS